MQLIFSIIITLFLAYECQAQLGCTDPQAENYDSGAMENDGSCTYSLTEFTPEQVTILPDLMKECSGVEFLPSGLWALNDGGNEDKIYRIDTTNGAVLHSIIIATADNIDWEDITEDETHLYIGDFGNNPGNRMDLQIHRINKSDLQNTVINSEIIEFEYSDQTNFIDDHNNHNFDCEAFFYYNDSLHLFSKNWDDNHTKHYILPASPGNHIAQLVETFNVNGLITGADISENGEVVLVGYNGFVNFMWLLFDYQNSQFFSGNKRRVALGIVSDNSQTEGVTFRGDGYGYIGSEEIVFDPFYYPPKILSFSIKQWIENTTSLELLDASYQIKVYPNPMSGLVRFEWPNPIDSWRLMNVDGKVLIERFQNNAARQDEFKTDHLPGGIYFLEIRKKDQTKTIQLFKL